MNGLIDSVGKRVIVAEYVNTGHHQVRNEYEGILTSVRDNLAQVRVELMRLDDGEKVKELDPPSFIWFNTMASTFEAIEEIT
jgi:hypothetical protein